MSVCLTDSLPTPAGLGALDVWLKIWIPGLNFRFIMVASNTNFCKKIDSKLWKQEYLKKTSADYN